MLCLCVVLVCACACVLIIPRVFPWLLWFVCFAQPAPSPNIFGPSKLLRLRRRAVKTKPTSGRTSSFVFRWLEAFLVVLFFFVFLESDANDGQNLGWKHLTELRRINMAACLGQRAAFLLASAERLADRKDHNSASWTATPGNLPLLSSCSRVAPSRDLAPLYVDSFTHIPPSLFQASVNFNQTLEGSLNNSLHN